MLTEHLHVLDLRYAGEVMSWSVVWAVTDPADRVHACVSDPGLKYKDEMDQMEGEGFSNWPEEQSRRHQGNTVRVRVQFELSVMGPMWGKQHVGWIFNLLFCF